ncbi:MAG: hypothetical protein ABIK28_07940 [Planctomycetota bacterium]
MNNFSFVIICCFATLLNLVYPATLLASVQPPLEQVHHSSPPEGYTCIKGEIEDFDHASFTESGTGKKLSSLISQEQNLYPLITVYEHENEVFGIPIQEELFDMIQEIVFEDDTHLVFETTLSGILIAYVTFEYDPLTERIWMYMADSFGSPVTDGEFEVAIDEGERSCILGDDMGRVKIPKELIKYVAAFVSGVVIAKISEPPDPPPSVATTEAPNGDKILFTAYPDGHTVSQIHHADGSITVITYDPNEDPKIKKEEIPPPKSTSPQIQGP